MIAPGTAQAAFNHDGAPTPVTLTGLAVGDYILVGGTVSTANAHVIAPTDDLGETYTAPDGLITDTTDQQEIRMWWAKVTVAGDHEVTMGCTNPVAGQTYCGIVACPVTGVAATAGVTANGPGQGQLTPGTGTDAVTSGTAQTPAGLPAGVFAFSQDVSTGAAAPNAGTGFSSLITEWDNGMRLEWKRITSGDAQGTFTTPGGVSTLTQMITLLEAAAAPAPGNSLFFGSGTTG